MMKVIHLALLVCLFISTEISAQVSGPYNKTLASKRLDWNQFNQIATRQGKNISGDPQYEFQLKRVEHESMIERFFDIFATGTEDRVIVEFKVKHQGKWVDIKCNSCLLKHNGKGDKFIQFNQCHTISSIPLSTLIPGSFNYGLGNSFKIVYEGDGVPPLSSDDSSRSNNGKSFFNQNPSGEKNSSQGSQR